jgi:hypothetical protein
MNLHTTKNKTPSFWTWVPTLVGMSFVIQHSLNPLFIHCILSILLSKAKGTQEVASNLKV